jgi:hypothetical protein
LWFISAGYVFVAINLQINGLGICLPTTVGYGLIVVGGWLLRDHPPFRLAVVPAALLAIVRFPNLFRGATDGTAMESFDRWTFWPSILLEIVLIAIVALGVWRIADSRGRTPLKRLATAIFPVLTLSLLAWWFFPVTSNATLIASFAVYAIPALFVAAVCAVAAQQLA